MGTPVGGPAVAREPAVGDCAACRHASVKRSARGGAFWRCGRADARSGLPRYPQLPVRGCPAREPGVPAGDSGAPQPREEPMG